MISIVVMKKAEGEDYPQRHRPWCLSRVEGGNGMSQELIPTSLRLPFPRWLNGPYYSGECLEGHVVHFVEE